MGLFLQFLYSKGHSLALFPLHIMGNHNLGKNNHFNCLVYTLYLCACFITLLKVQEK